MRHRTILTLGRNVAYAASLLLAFGTNAFAQSAVCERIARQIEALSLGTDSGGGGYGGDAARQADLGRQIQAQRAEASQISSYMRSIGCGQSNLRYGNDTPPECAPLGQRLRVMQQTIARLSQQNLQAGRAVNAARRQTLLDSYDAYNCTDAICDGDAASRAYRRQDQDTFFEPSIPSRRSGVTIGSALPSTIVPPLPSENDDLGSSVQIGSSPADPTLLPPRQGFNGRQPVCVRLCDGFFFPLSGASNPDEAQTICQAQCPESKTSVFLRSPNGEIGEATDLEGNAYASLPNALKYRTKTVDACTCRKTDQSWSATLKPAEELIEKKREDLTVTEKNADDIARGKLKLPGSDTRTGDAKGSQKRSPAKADGDAPVFSDVPLRQAPRPNVRIIETNKAGVP